MTYKTLIIDPNKCTGCRSCESYCALKHEGFCSPSKGRIHIVKWEQEGIFVPINCMRCEEPACELACPRQATFRNFDTGAMEVEMAAKAGADVAIVLGSADDSTILDALRSAHKYGIRLMADLISAPGPVSRAVELEALGVDYLNVHVGIDQQMMGMEPVSILMEIAEKVNVQLAVAGGLDAESAAQAVKAGAEIVIVGGNITRSVNVTEAAQKIRQSVDAPESVEIRDRGSLDQEIREILMEVSTSNISDALHRKGAMKGIHQLVRGKIVGKAVTVQSFAGDWAKTVEAIDEAKEGDVIVIYNESKDIACWGGLATLSSLNKGIAGVVIEGAVRDIDEVE